MKDILDLTYGAKIEPDGEGYLVTFRDIKNAFTYGETFDEAIFNAQEVLDLILLDRLEKKEAINHFFDDILPSIGNDLDGRINDNFQILKT